ncbi:HEAT repeat domain-containing protein [Paenibacillus sp. LMG 31456]|uniref:HEAT repeat domain-containing protein n=1 Tax=Paenibacillus foliorum TaxID=2654974 RepID=A0A972K0B2_9BACL|nr:HEAT repeat domain-containing protein [Paenibacillus foliorum]NOU94476.1 HEAT repeat domain-containing protein [Paenibacillus foliorum]
MSQDMGGLGRHYLQEDSYGASAFCFYRAILENNSNGNAWNGLVLAMSLMRKEYDAQTILARFALQQQLPYDKDMVTFALMMFQNSPQALAQWVRSMSVRFGASPEERQTFVKMAEDLDNAYNGLLAEHGEETLKSQGMLSLEEFANRRIELDWLLTESVDSIFALAQVWLEDPEMVLSGVRLLCMLPDPRSERMLRRVCRNEQVDGKVRTHALLALRWLGVRGNVRIHKMEESFVINLDDPKPELTVSVPASYKPALDRMKLWLAKEQGVVTQEEYEQHASTDEPELPEALAEKLENADIPGVLQEVVHAVIRAAYDQYYPLVPHNRGARSWSNAFVMLIKDYSEGIGQGWPYGEPEKDDTAVLHRNWMLSASPDFYTQIAEARKLRTASMGS